MKKFALCLTVLVLLLTAFGCAGGYGSPDEFAPSGEFTEDPSGDLPEESPENLPAAGQLTAGAWSDLDNWSLWLDLLTQGPNGQGEFAPAYAACQKGARFRFPVKVTRADRVLYEENGQEILAPAADVEVKLLADGQEIFAARTDAAGRAFLFADEIANVQGFRVRAGSGNRTAEAEALPGEEIVLVLPAAEDREEVLDLCLIVDTTGSMGDEISYLKAELLSVIEGIQSRCPNAAIRLSMIFYRDTSDENTSYLLRAFDFSRNVTAQREILAVQGAGGGGDYPEAVEQALQEMLGLSWSPSATRVAVHLLDAPPHDKNLPAFFRAVEKAAALGVRLLPVVSSGAEKDVEYLMRNAAIYTGSQYVFLTDDSGIGGEHLAPSVGDYTVEYLNDLLVRVISDLHNGTRTPPAVRQA